MVKQLMIVILRYPLVMTFTLRHGFSMALIEIDGKHRS